MDLLIDLDANILEGYPSRLEEVAAEILRRGSVAIRPKLVFSNSEKLHPAVRSKLRNAFGVEPTDVYESWEFGTVAWECPRHSGFHVNEDALILEIVREDGTEAEPGEEGEVVITDLHNRAMPFIRYATGDLAVRSDAPCECGITFPLLNEFVGRTSEKLYTSDGGSFAATTHLCGIISQFEGVAQYQFVQNEIGALDLRVVCSDEFMAQSVEKCRKEIMEFFGLESLNVGRVERIEKTSVGKYKTFVSNVRA
jgi:phenylacetate-CoA ligase